MKSNTTGQTTDLNGRTLRGGARLCIGLVLLSALVLLPGCAFNRPVLTRDEIGTNGLVVARTRLSISSYALWPATSQLAKQKASLGKTMSVGTDALEQQGAGTNLTESLKALKDLVQSLGGK